MRVHTRFLLIRHAHVDTGPPPGRLCGALDLPLSDKGRAQLASLPQQATAAHPADALYTSPLMRARETAAALGRMWRLVPYVDNRLAEIHCGRMEGLPLDILEREYPALWARNKAQVDDDLRWPGGESYRELRARVLLALARIAAAHDGGRIVIVTHAGVVAQVLGAIRGRPAAVWDQDRPAPFSGTEVEWANGAPQAVLRFNARDFA